MKRTARLVIGGLQNITNQSSRYLSQTGPNVWPWVSARNNSLVQVGCASAASFLASVRLNNLTLQNDCSLTEAENPPIKKPQFKPYLRRYSAE